MPPKKAMEREKSCEIKIGAQEMAELMVKKFNSDNSGEFVLPPPSFARIQQRLHFYHVPR